MELLLAVLACFAVAVLAPSVHRLLRHRAAYLLALVPAAAALWFSFQVPHVMAGGTRQWSHPWFPGQDIALALRLDGLGLLFALLVTVIGAFISVYAGGYLRGHKDLGRLLLFLYVFMGSMLGLVLADDLIAMFVFWELTSISSYFLIGFHQESEGSRRGALQALLVTGTGGLALLAGLVLLMVATGATTFSGVNAAGDALRQHALYLPALVLVLAGAFTKSAQFPFHFWLPGAMVAPTPVSAYLHSATMVKAGVFLLARLLPGMGGTTEWTVALVGFGTATFLVGTVVALRKNDLKQILAYTTVASLGFLTMLLGIATPRAVGAAMAFLLAHALYKGALFMVAGSVDHGAGTRDVERLGGLRRSMPFTAAAGLVATLSFAGLPPLFGFIAKEAVLEALLDVPAALPLLALVLVLLVGVFLAAYRVGVLPFWHRPGGMPRTPYESGVAMLAGPLVLAALGLLFGLVPALADGPLVNPAATAVLGTDPHVHFELWHGFTTPLLMSTAILAVGGLLVWRKVPVKRHLDRALSVLDGRTPERAYDLGVAGMLRFAGLQARFLQGGLLRVYLAVLFGFTALVLYATMLRTGALPSVGALDVHLHELLLTALLVAAGFGVVMLRSRLAAVVMLGVVGYAVAAFFILFSAPDLAMTQFLFETLSVLLFVLVLWGMPRHQRRSTNPGRARDALLATALGVMMGLLVLATTAGGRHDPISAQYGAWSYLEAHGRNVVNVILVDFRGLDTLGEITVLAVAAIGVVALLRLRPGGDA